MKNPDDAIQKVLEALRDAEPPAGMQRRILIEAQHRAHARPGWFRRPSLLASLLAPVPGRVLLACAFALAVAIAIGTAHRQAHTAPSSRTILMVSANPPSRNPHYAPQPKSRGPFEIKPQARRKTVSRTAIAKPREKSLALREMHAPSLLAPPLPLTEQERLLVKIVHQGDPQQFAMLNPEARSRQQAEGNAEFLRFFTPPSAKSDQKP